MVAFLEKSIGSEGFHQVIDFLNQSHICYALTKKPDITATIDGHSKTIIEASLRRHLKLDDHDSISSIPNSEIFEQLALMGYHTDSDKLTFQKGAFSPQWRFLIHTILHCLSSKKTDREQFSSNIATAVICLATNRKYNFSSCIISISNTINTTITWSRTTYFSTPNESPLYAVHSHRSAEGSLKLNELTNLVTKLSERIGVLEDDLKKTKLTYSSAFTKLILRIKKLEFKVKTGKARQRARVVLSEDEEDDSSKQGRKLSDAEVQEKASTETEPIIQEVTPTEVIQDQGSSEKGNSEVSTAGATKGTASEVPVVSTAEVNISTAGRTVTYRRRSEEKRTRKDKGKAIMTEPEPMKKSKKLLEQERLGLKEAIRLQEQVDEEERAQVARDEEIARQLLALDEERVTTDPKTTKDIDWNDPSVQKYWDLKNKPKSEAQARKNMIVYLKNQSNYKMKDFKGIASLRRHLKLEDHDGITSIPNSEIFEQLTLMGYQPDSDKLTFQKGVFSPQWRFLIHTLLHCLSPKKTAWEQFSSNIATALICLATNRKYNFSRLIFEHMVTNIGSPHKFLMYPRFIQICLDMQKKQLKTHSSIYSVPSLNNKVFSNMRRLTKGYSGVEIRLFPTMLTSPLPEPSPTPSSSPSRITSSPSLSSEPSTEPTFEPQPSPDAEYHVPTPNESPLHDDLKKIKQTYSSAFTKLILKIKKLEYQVKIRKARKRARVVLLEDEEDDSSKQGRRGGGGFWLSRGKKKMILPNWRKLSDARKHVRIEFFQKLVLLEQTKGTASEKFQRVSTAEVNISTAGRTVTYKRRSEEKRTRKDKGKSIMTEPEPKKKSKKELEQERQWDEEEGQRAMSEAKSSKKIDWNDPSVIRYHDLKMKPKTVVQARRNMVKYLKNLGNYKISDFKGMSYNEIRLFFEKVWDFNQHIEPMDLEHGSERMKSPEKIEEEDVDTQKEMKEVSKESGAKRKKSLPRKSTRSTVKRQKMELDDEKEDLKGYLDIVPREDVAEDVESLSTKYPIVDWKTYTLSENFMYYKIIRGDGSSKNYKILSEMLYDFDRQDIMELYRLVKERYSSSKPEGYDLMLWGDLHTLFEPDEESEIWMNQNEYNLISWNLCDFCGVHILLMQNGIAIHMLTEKKYPLSQEMLSKMLSKRLEVDHESTQAYELLKFIRSQVQK
ncbi:hypothetical protein Tco_0647812 [Tanacetum coccineum]